MMFWSHVENATKINHLSFSKAEIILLPVLAAILIFYVGRSLLDQYYGQAGYAIVLDMSKIIENATEITIYQLARLR